MNYDVYDAISYLISCVAYTCRMQFYASTIIRAMLSVDIYRVAKK